MSSEPTIILYDIPQASGPQPWSPNTWKARLVLNYKRLPYKTKWVEYPDIKETMLSIGGKPTGENPYGEPLYTLPAILDTTSGSPVVVTDSCAIAEYLDAKYPERPVFPKNGKALEYAFEAALTRIIVPHFAKLVRPRAYNILSESSQPYFRETREKWYGKGKKLEEWSPEGPGREADLEAFRKAWDEISNILDKNGAGVDYVAGGSNPTRADFIIVSHIAWIISVTPGDWEKKVRHWNGGRWERLWKLSEEWRAIC